MTSLYSGDQSILLDPIYTQNIIYSTCNQYKIINELFYIFFHTVFEIWWVFYTYITSQPKNLMKNIHQKYLICIYTL